MWYSRSPHHHLIMPGHSFLESPCFNPNRTHLWMSSIWTEVNQYLHVVSPPTGPSITSSIIRFVWRALPQKNSIPPSNEWRKSSHVFHGLTQGPCHGSHGEVQARNHDEWRYGWLRRSIETTRLIWAAGTDKNFLSVWMQSSLTIFTALCHGQMEWSSGEATWWLTIGIFGQEVGIFFTWSIQSFAIVHGSQHTWWLSEMPSKKGRCQPQHASKRGLCGPIFSRESCPIRFLENKLATFQGTMY